MSTIIVTATYSDGAGNPMSGTVTFTPVVTGTDGTVVFLGEPVTARVTAGLMSKELQTTDSWTTPGAVTYKVVEKVGSSGRVRFFVSLPSTLGSTVDMSSLLRYSNPPNQLQIDAGDTVDFTSHLANDHGPITTELTNIDGRLDALEAAGGNFYELPIDGIPQADLDAATEAKLDGAVQKTIVDAKGDIIAATAADTVTRLPVGANNTVLTADSAQATGVKWASPSVTAAIPPTIADAKGDIIAATAADTVARVPVGTDDQILTADSAQAAGVKWAAVPSDANKANVSGTLTQFSDVSDTAPTDLDVLRYDGGVNQYIPTDISAEFAQLDANARIVSSAEPQYYVPILVVNEGDPVPAEFPAGGIVLSRPSSGSLIPVGIGTGVANAAVTSVVATTTEVLNVGDYLVCGVMTSGEDTTPTGGMPQAVTFTIEAPGAASGGWTKMRGGYRAGTVQADIYYARITTASGGR